VTGRESQRTQVVRPEETYAPAQPARREVLVAMPAAPAGTIVAPGEPVVMTQPPVLLVPGLGHGAWSFAEHWLDHVALRGFPAYAMSLRGQGASQDLGTADLAAYTHDVVQVAAGLPRQAVLLGHGVGALVVAMAMSRYPVRAGVLVSPLFGGPREAWNLMLRNPGGALPALFGGRVRLSTRQLFSGELTDAAAASYVSRMGRIPNRLVRQLTVGQRPQKPVGNPPVLVVGSPDDQLVSDGALDQVAKRYGGAPLLFPGMGHDLPLDARWREPVDAICDWLRQRDQLG
jgi:pimeloyl-ACP methyl ester carboxylesterase